MKENLFDLTSSLRKVQITIDGIDIPKEDIIEVEIKWENDNFEVYGAMILKDNRDITEFFEDWDKKIVNIYITDLSDKTMSRDFYIGKIEETKGDEENTKNFEISLIDKISFNLKNTYVSKSYKGKKITEIIEDLWGIFKFDDLYDKKYISKKFTPSEEVYEFIVVPQDRNLLEFFQFQLRQEGYIMFQQKNEICIKSFKEILPSSLTADPLKDLKEDIENPTYQHKILDTTGSFMKFYEALKHPSNTTYSFNPKTKKMEKIEKNLSDMYSDFKTSKEDESYIQGTVGKKFSIEEANQNPQDVALSTYLHFMKNTSVEFFVPGSIADNNLMEKRNAFFKGSSNNIKGDTEGNKKLSGEYLIFSIWDKILGEKMISRMFGCRLNNTSEFGKKPESKAQEEKAREEHSKTVEAQTETPVAETAPLTVNEKLSEQKISTSAALTNSTNLSSVASVATQGLSTFNTSISNTQTAIQGAVAGIISDLPTGDIIALKNQAQGYITEAQTKAQSLESFGKNILDGDLSAVNNIIPGLTAQIGPLIGDIVNISIPNISILENLKLPSIELPNLNLPNIDLSFLKLTDINIPNLDLAGLTTLSSGLGNLMTEVQGNISSLSSISNNLGIKIPKLEENLKVLTEATDLTKKLSPDAIKKQMETWVKDQAPVAKLYSQYSKYEKKIPPLTTDGILKVNK